MSPPQPLAFAARNVRAIQRNERADSNITSSVMSAEVATTKSGGLRFICERVQVDSARPPLPVRKEYIRALGVRGAHLGGEPAHGSRARCHTQHKDLLIAATERGDLLVENCADTQAEHQSICPHCLARVETEQTPTNGGDTQTQRDPTTHAHEPQ